MVTSPPPTDADLHLLVQPKNRSGYRFVARSRDGAAGNWVARVPHNGRVVGIGHAPTAAAAACLALRWFAARHPADWRQRLRPPPPAPRPDPPPPPPASREELSLLFSRRSETRYRNVYVCGKDCYGNTRYVAKVKMGRRLRCVAGSRSTDVRHAAACVVGWYKKTFGDRWREALVARKRCPWRIWWDDSRCAWGVVIWIRGVPQFLPDAADPTNPAMFWTVADARKAVDAFRASRAVETWRLGRSPHAY